FKIASIVIIFFVFVVVIIALFISFVAILPTMQYATIIALVLALPLAFIKIYKRDFLVHNITELFVYPGIAAVFVPILNLWTIIALLIIISIYDMWAVWHSGIMQKMARYQIDKLNIFSGFFIPYVSKKVKMQIQKMKKFNPKKLKTKKIKVNVAILGGGDVIFPIITAGVMLQFSLVHALFVTVGATAGLTYLLIFSEKKKFYPAMPFISAGIFIGMILSWFVL
ncbi:MAG: presenilin family intramembrane aspartyl protease, partial [Nanoarchaeota archaeon]